MTTSKTAQITLDDLRAMTTPVVSVEDASRVLGLDPRTVRSGCEKGQIPSVKVGRRVLVLREQLITMLS